MPRRNSISGDDGQISLIERIPNVKYFCFIFGLRFGSMFIAVSGIVLGCTSFLAYLLLIGRSELNFSTVILLLELAVFALISVVFIVGSVMLVIAITWKSPDFVPAYIWISIIYWTTQLVLGVLLPIVLILDGNRSSLIALIWSCLVMSLGLLWTHYLAVVKSYMWLLYNEDYE